jgi:hypothetical protein
MPHLRHAATSRHLARPARREKSNNAPRRLSRRGSNRGSDSFRCRYATIRRECAPAHLLWRRDGAPSSCVRRRSTFPRVKFLSRVLTALNLLPSIATLASITPAPSPRGSAILHGSSVPTKCCSSSAARLPRTPLTRSSNEVADVALWH